MGCIPSHRHKLHSVVSKAAKQLHYFCPWGAQAVMLLPAPLYLRGGIFPICWQSAISYTHASLATRQPRSSAVRGIKTSCKPCTLQLTCSLLVNSALFPSCVFVSGGIGSQSSHRHQQHLPEPSLPPRAAAGQCSTSLRLLRGAAPLFGCYFLTCCLANDCHHR